MKNNVELGNNMEQINNLKITYLNIRSMRNKIPDLEILLKQSLSHILILLSK